ncbi:hypothetical protein M2284_002705 [Rhodococcus sp. LBL1]|nr:hypothetical protein [Rhodococcus sp. LBL1]MDH6684089.1 hypothetical protein [Rhodococcus sp. LBL2]
MSTPEVRALASFIDDVLPHDRSHWPPGWPGETEAALLDAVFSARATYGTPTSGVRRVIGNWRAHRDAELDDLSALAAFADSPDRLAEILGNRQRVPGNYTTKAEAAARTAAVLIEAGIRDSSRIGDGRAAWEAIAAIPGLGATTWETFMLRLGLIGPTALDAVHQFVADALGADESSPTEAEALDLLAATADSASIDPAALLGAIWRYHRARDRAPKSLSA